MADATSEKRRCSSSSVLIGHTYFPAAQGAEDRQREKFVEQVAAAFDDRVPRIDGWDGALEYLGEKLAHKTGWSSSTVLFRSG